MAPAPPEPTTDQARRQSRGPSDRLARPPQGRRNRTIALDPGPTAPSSPVSADSPISATESLFAGTINRLLQQNRPCVDGSGLARVFFTFAALVGAAMCSAFERGTFMSRPSRFSCSEESWMAGPGPATSVGYSDGSGRVATAAPARTCALSLSP